LQAKNWTEASAQINAFLDEYPESDLRDGALYYLALAEYMRERFDAAKATLSLMEKEHPDSRHLPAALNLQGDLFFRASDWEAADQTYAGAIRKGMLLQGLTEDLAMQLGEFNAGALPDPFRHEMDVLALKALLPAARRGRKVNIEAPPLPNALAPLADARLANARGEVLRAQGRLHEALDAYARAIVHAAPEDTSMAASAAQALIVLLEESGNPEEAALLRDVAEILLPAR
jgi:tetratricopeptide (TPR) repeat protein